jgi:hypothetical protein
MHCIAINCDTQVLPAVNVKDNLPVLAPIRQGVEGCNFLAVAARLAPDEGELK